MSTLPVSAYEGLGLSERVVKILTKPASPPKEAASPNVLQAEPQSANRLAMDSSSITLYAELLLNIRTVTLFASLRSAHTRETKAKLSTDGYAITVTHESESATIRLPIKAEGGGDASLSLPANPPRKELSLRLQIEEQEGSELFTGAHAEERKANLVPWDGASLTRMRMTKISCKNCQTVVVRGDAVKQWRDLPNENWAEMMDFWHCHKPSEHHQHDHTNDETVANKGYAAGNQLRATPGIGFVDLLSLLFTKQDCEVVESSTNSANQSLVCRSCEHTLGTRDDSAQGWRLWKWTIHVDNSSSPTPPPSVDMHAYTPQKWISARLLYLVENHGSRKFHVHPYAATLTSTTPALLLWVFTPDLLFSSSTPSSNRHDPTRAMKVFYKKQTWSPPKPGDPESASVEDVEFPVELFWELQRGLEEGKGLLPAGARGFQGWDVGLLGRFDLEDVKIDESAKDDQEGEQEG